MPGAWRGRRPVAERFPRLAAAARRLAVHCGFQSRRGRATATVAVAALCALLALLRGQDMNWDLRNYHLHNAWAWLQGRVGLDLAPAQMQSYFAPWLDLPYYLLALHAPAPLAGLLLGLLHGLAFLPAAWVAWRMLEGDARRGWLAPLLALSGLAGAAFLAELGNTMGDASTAPLVLGALALALPEGGRWRGARLAWAGLLLGAAVALKLTNAVYAVALGLAVLAAPGRWTARLWAATRLAAAALAVFALLDGPWLWTLWHTFGNPLFPQFNAWFQAPLAQPVSVADVRWLPSSLGEALLRPLLFTARPHLVSEVGMRQLIWALLYLAALATLAAWPLRRLRACARPATGDAAVARLFTVFFVAGFVLWLALFSIHRYLVVLELLAPLALWGLLQRLLPPRRVGRVAGPAIALSALVALSGWGDWGHAGWRREAFRVERPAGPAPAAVLLVGDQPQAWRLPFLWTDTTYASVGSNFPESAAYADRIRRIAASGAVLAMLSPGESAVPIERRAQRIERLNRWAARLGLDDGDCALMRALARRNRRLDLAPDGGPCRFVAADDAAAALAQADAALMAQAQQILSRYGLALDADGCRDHASWIGDQAFAYRLCPVRGGG